MLSFRYCSRVGALIVQFPELLSVSDNRPIEPLQPLLVKVDGGGLWLISVMFPFLVQDLIDDFGCEQDKTRKDRPSGYQVGLLSWQKR